MRLETLTCGFEVEVIGSDSNIDYNRGFKYRFYPNDAQRLELAQTFGCTRFVYNWALALRTNSYYQDNVSLSYTDTSNALTKLKRDPEKSWLKQVSAVPLQQGLRHLNTAFINFFAGRNKYPRFKKKNGGQSAHYAPNAFKWQDGKLTLAKMSQPLMIRWSRYFSGQPKSVTISKDPSNRYFVSFLVEEELDTWQATEGKIGVDLGVKDVMVTSTSFASGNPKYYQKYQARLKTLQRRLAKKKKGSNNRYKARLKVARLHAKIADCRKDFLHKLTTRGLESAEVRSKRVFPLCLSYPKPCLSVSRHTATQTYPLCQITDLSTSEYDWNIFYPKVVNF